MRFLFLDRVLALERGRRILATKTVTLMDEYLTGHYGRCPIMPATLVLECLAQTGGWLSLVSRDFSVKIVLAVIEGAQLHRHIQPGDTLMLEVEMLYAHADGATMRGEARAGTELIGTVARIVFAHELVRDESFVREQRERFRYVSGGFPLPEDARR